MSIEIKVPSPGESISEVTVSKWLKQVGDYVQLDEPLVELESEKATFEVNAESAGVLTKQLAKEGDEIKVGSVIVEIDETAKAPENTAPKAEAKKKLQLLLRLKRKLKKNQLLHLRQVFQWTQMFILLHWQKN